MNNDVNVSSLTNKNIIRWNGSSWVNVADLTNAETNISNLQVSTGILVNTTNTSQNATIVTSFSDSSSSSSLMQSINIKINDDETNIILIIINKTNMIN